MKSFIKTVLFTALLLPSLSNAGQATGKIESVANSIYALDNFAVVIKPGWRGSGCGTYKNSNSSVTFLFNPSWNNNKETYERNFAIAMGAMAANKTVTISSFNDKNGGCGAFAISVAN